MNLLVRLAIILLLMSSCVVNKKYQLLQKGDVNKKDMPVNSVIRDYEIGNDNYKLQTNDILSITIQSLSPKEYDFLSALSQGGEIIDIKGEITFPVVGKVKIVGMTVFEAQEYLQSIANKYLESAIVKLRLTNFRVTFLGEVNHETTVTFTNNRVNMLEALSLAGGLSEFSDKTSIKLIRQNGTKSEVVYLNLLDENFITSPYYYVHQNDIYIVPTLRQRTFRKYFFNNLSLVLSSLSVLLLVINYTK